MSREKGFLAGLVGRLFSGKDHTARFRKVRPEDIAIEYGEGCAVASVHTHPGHVVTVSYASVQSNLSRIDADTGIESVKRTAGNMARGALVKALGDGDTTGFMHPTARSLSGADVHAGLAACGVTFPPIPGWPKLATRGDVVADFLWRPDEIVAPESAVKVASQLGIKASAFEEAVGLTLARDIERRRSQAVDLADRQAKAEDARRSAEASRKVASEMAERARAQAKQLTEQADKDEAEATKRLREAEAAVRVAHPEA